MKIAKLLVPCLLVLGMGASAKADCGDLGLAYLFGYGGFNSVGMRSYNNATPPYFALHPPVYYGQRYTRPYGVSPFAAWPQLQSNSAYAPAQHVDRGITIDNPYVAPGLVRASSSPVVVTVEPIQSLVIENPYYVETSQPAEGNIQYTSK